MGHDLHNSKNKNPFAFYNKRPLATQCPVGKCVTVTLAPSGSETVYPVQDHSLAEKVLFLGKHVTIRKAKYHSWSKKNFLARQIREVGTILLRARSTRNAFAGGRGGSEKAQK